MAAFVMSLTTFVIALASAHSNNVDMVTPESFMELGTHRHLQALMSNMTVQVAMAKPPSMPTELRAFVQQQLGGGQAFLQKSSKSMNMLATMDADKARTVLNKMAMDTMAKLDMQKVECMSQQTKQEVLLDETNQDMSSFNAQGTTARAQVMATQTAMKRLEESIPKLNYELELHESKCKESRVTLKKQISLVQTDAGTLAQVSGMASCSSLLQTGLLHCHKDKTHQGKSFIEFGHKAIRRKAAQLKLSSSKQALQTVLLEVAHRHSRRHRRAHHRRAHKHHHRRHHDKRVHRHQHKKHAHKGHNKHLVLLSGDSKSHAVGVANATVVQPAGRCAMRSNPDCNTLRDKLMMMQAGVVDEVDGRLAELDSIETDCKSTKANLQDQLKSAAQRLQEQQEMLAETTTISINAAEQTRLKGIQLDHLQKEHSKMTSFCQETLNQAALELCKVKSIRQELYKMEQKRPFIQDCEVGAWVPTECTKVCGGGTQNLVRQVVVPDDKGAACPPLAAQQSCNTHQCPKNCNMAEWSGWTSCSSKCGGGIKQRIRHVKQRAEHGGKVCSADSESVGCGMAACDQDCELASWGRWSSCSRACGGGFQQRTKKELVATTGLGKCPAKDSESRLQYKRCNPDVCKPKSGELLKCASKVDVTILLDGSGSLGAKGWDSMKKAAASLVTAMDPNANGGNGAQVAVLMYSGPKDMASMKKCIGEKSAVAGAKPLDMVQDCKMIWVSHYTTSNTAIAEGIGNLIWQKGSTMTSMALASAEAELVYGRADAKQVVIALADKLPMMPRKTGEAAASLRKKARLIWAAASGPSELSKFASYASRPVADNLVYMQHVADFTKPENLNKIISAACPEVA